MESLFYVLWVLFWMLAIPFIMMVIALYPVQKTDDEISREVLARIRENLKK
jgi:hypothetical protein